MFYNSVLKTDYLANNVYFAKFFFKRENTQKIIV